MIARGVVKGKTIELDEATDLADGQRVDVDIRAVPDYSGPGQYLVSVRLEREQRDFDSDRERKYESVFPTTIHVEMPVVGEELIRAIRAELGDMEGDADAPKYSITVLHKDGPPVAPVYYKGTKCFEDAVRVPLNIYSKDLMRIMMKAIGVDESETRVSAFRPFSGKGKRKPLPDGFDTNELVNQLREEMGI